MTVHATQIVALRVAHLFQLRIPQEIIVAFTPMFLDNSAYETPTFSFPLTPFNGLESTMKIRNFENSNFVTTHIHSKNEESCREEEYFHVSFLLSYH